MAVEERREYRRREEEENKNYVFRRFLLPSFSSSSSCDDEGVVRVVRALSAAAAPSQHLFVVLPRDKTVKSLVRTNSLEEHFNRTHSMSATTTTTAKEDSEEDRSISRFLRRGEEIAKHEPTTSYYCKLRAVELAMEMHPRPIDLIKKLLGELEVRERFVERENLLSRPRSFVRSLALETSLHLNPNSLSFSLVFDF